MTHVRGGHIIGRRPQVDSLKGLLHWLKRQDPDTIYRYGDCTDCILCRYFRAQGIPVRTISRDGYTLDNKGEYSMQEYNKKLDTASNIRVISTPAGYSSTYKDVIAKIRNMLLCG